MMKKFLNFKGFTLIELMIGIGMSGMAALALMQMGQIRSTDQKRAKNASVSTELTSLLQAHLTNEEACEQTFGALTLADVQNITADRIAGYAGGVIAQAQNLAIRNAANQPLMAPGQEYLETGMIVRGIYFNGYLESAVAQPPPPPLPALPPPLRPPATAVSFFLNIVLDRTVIDNNGTQSVNSIVKRFPFPIRMEYDDASGTMTKCYGPITDAIEIAREKACSDLGGAYTPGLDIENYPADVNAVRSFCTLPNYGDPGFPDLATPSPANSGNPSILVTTQYLKDRFEDVAGDLFCNNRASPPCVPRYIKFGAGLAPQSIDGSVSLETLTATKPGGGSKKGVPTVSVGSDPNANGDAVPLSFLEDVDKVDALPRCGAGQIGVMVAQNVTVANSTDGRIKCLSMQCPAGQYFRGITVTGDPLCTNLVLGGSCTAGQVGTLSISNTAPNIGEIIYTCTPSPFRNYTCNVGSWGAAATPCNPSSGGSCTGGSLASGVTLCCGAGPSSTCEGGSRRYTCTNTGWNDTASCSGASDGICSTGGPAAVSSTACCASSPSNSTCGTPPATLTITATNPNAVHDGEINLSGGLPGERIFLRVELVQVLENNGDDAKNNGFYIDFPGYAATAIDADFGGQIRDLQGITLNGSGDGTIDYEGFLPVGFGITAVIQVTIIARDGGPAIPAVKMVEVRFDAGGAGGGGLERWTCSAGNWSTGGPGPACAVASPLCPGPAGHSSGINLCCIGKPDGPCSAGATPDLQITSLLYIVGSGLAQFDVLFGEINEELDVTITLTGPNTGMVVMNSIGNVTPNGALTWTGTLKGPGNQSKTGKVNLDGSGGRTFVINTGLTFGINKVKITITINGRSSGEPMPGSQTSAYVDVN